MEQLYLSSVLKCLTSISRYNMHQTVGKIYCYTPVMWNKCKNGKMLLVVPNMLKEYYGLVHSWSTRMENDGCSKSMHLQLLRYLSYVQQIHVFYYLQSVTRKTRASFQGFALKLDYFCVLLEEITTFMSAQATFGTRMGLILWSAFTS